MRQLLLIWIIGAGPLWAQPLATITVPASQSSPWQDIPVSINLDRITHLPDTILRLELLTDDGFSPVDVQIDAGTNRTLHWILPRSNAAVERKYQLVKSNASPKVRRLTATRENGVLTIGSDGTPLVQYNYATIYPPAGVDSAYRRSGFIHPLWSPSGKVLTRIQPPDHYHHYGIWNPWTHILFDGDTIDLWNLNRRQGTVRFAGFMVTEDGPVYTAYTTAHEHVRFTDSGEQTILNELQTLRVYHSPRSDHYIADLTIELNCASDMPVRLLEYRYGGLGWRATEVWTNKNSAVLTSEGKSRKDADGSRAEWCLVQGAFGNDHAGVLMMSFPTNYNHPEPLRIWPEDQYGRGDMFANFSPTRDRDWLLLPGKTYVLKYRLLVFDGILNGDQSAEAWEVYSHPEPIGIVLHH